MSIMSPMAAVASQHGATTTASPYRYSMAPTQSYAVPTSSYAAAPPMTTTVSYPGSYSTGTMPVSYSTTAMPVTTYTTARPGLMQSVQQGAVYVPPNAEYVPPGMALRGGMYPVYDTAAVPTFEAPLVFGNGVGADATAPRYVVKRNVNDDRAYRSPSLPKHSTGRKAKKGCC